MEYEISYIGDPAISDVRHISVNFNGSNYNVIFGKYINGGFFSIPNWHCGGELAGFDDVFWNTESIYNSLKRKKAAEAIANAITDYMKIENK